MNALASFDVAIGRAQHLLRLYELICNTRARRERKKWRTTFNGLMNWPSAEAIVRVDGKNRDSVLVIRARANITRSMFSHEYLSELLRSVVVTSVSALDRYMHDLIVQNCWKLLTRKDADIPSELKKLDLPVLATKTALQRLRTDSSARPGNLVKQTIQTRLHRNYTFQKPDDVARGAKMLGVENFWAKVAKGMQGQPSKGDVIERLKGIAERRDQIVHEADFVRKTRAKQVTLRDIRYDGVREDLIWMDQLVRAIDGVVASSL